MRITNPLERNVYGLAPLDNRPCGKPIHLLARPETREYFGGSIPTTQELSRLAVRDTWFEDLGLSRLDDGRQHDHAPIDYLNG
jgi:hypothetical protein